MSSGSQIQIAGYAKLAVLNGYPGVYGYLGQYFDQAYQIDANGNVTTNTTGVLSPYGNFFATEPGPAALVTMPDVDTGERGICTVNCFSEVLDKNHNTNVLDTSFSGPNATSQASPLRWWINNDDDAPGVYGGLDHDIESPGMPPDYAFSDPIYGNGKTCVHSQRDLEDYTRLWICGVPALTNGGYQVTMSWANVSSGNPVVKLFQSVETNGGTLYLTDTNVAATQAAVQTYVLNTNMAYYIPGPGVSIGTVSNGATFTFPASYFTNSGNKYLLFEGAGIGAGELVMTISQNGNAIAQTGVWLDLHDVRDFYERAVITNNMSGALSNWTSGIEMVQPATASALGDDQDLIVLIHGINVRPMDCLQQGDTVFKWLYLGGLTGNLPRSNGPATCSPPFRTAHLDCFNRSEMQAYKASTALTNYLAQLRARFPEDGLHLLVHSQGNAIVSEAIRRAACHLALTF